MFASSGERHAASKLITVTRPSQRVRTPCPYNAYPSTILRRLRSGVSLDRLSPRVARANHFGWALTEFPLRTEFSLSRRITVPATRVRSEQSEFMEWVHAVAAIRDQGS